MNCKVSSQLVLEQADAVGFGLVGIAPARPSERADYIRGWLNAGRHGEMGYLDHHLDVRLDPGRLLDGAQSVIVVADAYPSEAPASSGSKPAPAGRIARYAWGDDYHKVIKKRLHTLCDTLGGRFPEAAFRAAVDTAPILEREHAVAAGLGWVGKHTLLIHPRHGSWLMLGVIVTTVDLAASQELGHPGGTVPPVDHCGTCTRCIDACPTDAIAQEGYRLDATRCISYLTLEHRSPIDPSLFSGMEDWLAGCDICQAVCPHNGDKAVPLPIHPRYEPRNTALPLLDVLGWSADDRQAAFIGSALKRVKLDMLKRNALIAAGNALSQSDEPALLRRVREVAADDAEPEMVRETASQVLERLGST